MRCAVLDLGSTSFQLLVTDAAEDGSLTHVLRDRVILNLGAEVASSGRVSDELARPRPTDRGRFRDIAERSGAERLWPVATAAFREAANQPWLSKALRGALGVPRARSSPATRRCGARRRASARASRSPTGRGSRSTWGRQPRDRARRRATSSLDRHLPARRGARVGDDGGAATRWRDPSAEHIRKVVKEMLRPPSKPASRRPTPMCIIAGGTAGALARLIAARRWSRSADVAQPVRGLGGRAPRPGSGARRGDARGARRPARASTTPSRPAARRRGGACRPRWNSSARARRPQRVGAARGGRACASSRRRCRRRPASLRAGAIDHLAATWRVDDGTPRRSAGTRSGCSTRRRICTISGRRSESCWPRRRGMHEIGARISPDKHHKHGAYVVEHAGLRGFSPDEVAMMACIVRFQRGSPPRASLPAVRGADADRAGGVPHARRDPSCRAGARPRRGRGRHRDRHGPARARRCTSRSEGDEPRPRARRRSPSRRRCSRARSAPSAFDRVRGDATSGRLAAMIRIRLYRRRRAAADRPVDLEQARNCTRTDGAFVWLDAASRARKRSSDRGCARLHPLTLEDSDTRPTSEGRVLRGLRVRRLRPMRLRG